MAKSKSTQKDVIALRQLSDSVFVEQRPGCGKAVLHEDAAMQMSVYRIAPGCGVPAHYHSSSNDVFVGLSGAVEIEWNCGSTTLEQGGFCRIPPGVTHKVSNRSEITHASFVLVHSGFAQFDYIEKP